MVPRTFRDGTFKEDVDGIISSESIFLRGSKGQGLSSWPRSFIIGVSDGCWANKTSPNMEEEKTYMVSNLTMDGVK